MMLMHPKAGVGGTACLACGLDEAHAMLENFGRPGVPKYVVIVSSHDHAVPAAKDVAKDIKDMGATVIAVGAWGEKTDPHPRLRTRPGTISCPSASGRTRTSPRACTPRYAINPTTLCSP